MASVTLHIQSPPLNNDVVSLPRNHFPIVTFKTTFFGSSLTANGKPLSLPKTFRTQPVITSSSSSSSSTHTFDVVIIGAGIIWLTIARQFLIGSDLSVAVVDKDVPCSGATGAGQGYLWMVHKEPESDTWDLTMRSYKLWQMFAEKVRAQGLDPLQELGSLLVGRTAKEAATLKKKVKRLSEAGLRAEYLTSDALRLKEPELEVGKDDCQLDAQRAVAFIQKANRHFSIKGRYAEFFHDPVTGLLRSNSSSEVEGVRTFKNTLYSKKAVIVAAGCWSGSLAHDLFRESDILLNVPVKPRKGHLVVLENFSSFRLDHGLMEMGYVDHLHDALDRKSSHSVKVEEGQTPSVSMTATMDTMGNLVLGSSRQFTGYNTKVDESIINHIWKRTGEFFPKLKELPLEDFTLDRKVRI
uniref:FAD-dependent oxidoreductase domain-containing protein 1 n=1 Tax=Populus trichocarpa TaxID=3694 RepID=A0A3N7HKF3_POPTR